jgi:hypothetical protein
MLAYRQEGNGVKRGTASRNMAARDRYPKETVAGLKLLLDYVRPGGYE